MQATAAVADKAAGLNIYSSARLAGMAIATPGATAWQRALAERTQWTGQRWRYRELPTGHNAMVTMPQQLAAALLELV